MKFAINYSPQAATLVDSGAVRVDLFKCPDWPDLLSAASAHCSAYVHFPLRAGPGGLEDDGLARVGAMAEAFGNPYVNMHLTPWASDFAHMPVDTRSPSHGEEIFQAIHRDVMCLADRFGREKVVLENIMRNTSRRHQVLRPALEPGRIGRVVRATGCGFLLDLAHAVVSARFLGMDEGDYLAELPTERLRELHVSGLMQKPDGTWVDHFALSEEDWALTEWVVERIRRGRWPAPWVMTFEYGGVGPLFETRSETAVIAEQAPRLYDLARSVATRG